MKVLFFLILVVAAQSLAAQTTWPKEIPLSGGGKITIYEPQPESLNNNQLIGRAAVAVTKSSSSEPVFGAISFEAVLQTDRDKRMATLESVTITSAKFPGVEDSSELKLLSQIIEKEVPKWNLDLSLDLLIASIKKENPDKSGTDNFKNNAPKIYYRNKATTLVILDGEPKIQKDKDLDADRVVNSPSLIFKEANQWNMYNGGIWYKSTSVTSGWSPNQNLSTKLQSVNTQIKKQEQQNNGGKSPTETPKVTDILVSTEPAELLQTDGEAQFKNVEGTSLLYVSNSSNDIFKDINSQKTYVLLSGRWFSAPAISGPWEYIPSDKLPEDFAKIPPGSAKDAVLSSVAGTNEAEEAKMDAVIPQTAKVDRSTATVKVEYDGPPKFVAIDNTSLLLAENANVTVMEDAMGNYFALDNGIWFIGPGPNGPWKVSDKRPQDVDKIPPQSAAYNTKYVYVYQTTPQYVYVGYTPGYMGCYIYGPTVVYGTGFYYNPWYGAVYYPRPYTWGFGFSYNPWTGWSMGVGFNVGYMHVGFAFGGGYGYRGGWYGPPMYHPPYRPPYYGGGGYYGNGGRPVPYNRGNTNIYINNSHNNIYNNHNGVTTRDVNRAGNNANFNRGNSGSNQVGNGNQGGGANAGGANRPATRPSTGNNNVFADKSGNVYQKANNGGWNQRDNKSSSWKPSSNNPSAGNLNRQSQMRDRGNQRASNYNRAQSSGSSRPSGGGGGRRR